MNDSNSQEVLARERLAEIGYAETERRIVALEADLATARECSAGLAAVLETVRVQAHKTATTFTFWRRNGQYDAEAAEVWVHRDKDAIVRAVNNPSAILTRVRAEAKRVGAVEALKEYLGYLDPGHGGELAWPELRRRIAALISERDQLREQLKEERLTSEDEARKRDEHFAENDQLRTALRETREALADTLDLATKAAVCEMEAIVSTEPGSTVFGCGGISEKAKVARARAAWKALDDRVKPVLARHAALAGEEMDCE